MMQQRLHQQTWGYFKLGNQQQDLLIQHEKARRGSKQGIKNMDDEAHSGESSCDRSVRLYGINCTAEQLYGIIVQKQICSRGVYGSDLEKKAAHSVLMWQDCHVAAQSGC